MLNGLSSTFLASAIDLEVVLQTPGSNLLCIFQLKPIMLCLLPYVFLSLLLLHLLPHSSLIGHRITLWTLSSSNSCQEFAIPAVQLSLWNWHLSAAMYVNAIGSRCVAVLFVLGQAASHWSDCVNIHADSEQGARGYFDSQVRIQCTHYTLIASHLKGSQLTIPM